ncbi:hypothetical protein N5V81_05790 [Escherichia coli]|nr:hypothetical protein [Escherichia coli]
MADLQRHYPFLRDYLLPENSGVRKAFQDYEAALRENRMTLEAIRVTQSTVTCLSI